ncbi:YybS family protein [Geomonas sp. Red32]|uniref:YybS family protein n=1 Tax=Geomonas sp. Red32 TaxID=2912856 RepID=UPI00202D081C|nr:YybS family protein [Geomonas sp. Red32]MCM0084275.1 YybS family protein [Geomonas sp. Red32]
MNPQLQGRILDVIKGSVATAALFLAFMMLPVLGLIPGFFTPLPAVFYRLKSGRGTGIAIVVATSVLLAAIAREPATVAIYLLQGGIMSLALPEFLMRLKGGARSVVYSVAINLVFLLAATAIYGAATGAPLHAKIVKGVQTSIAQTSQLYEKAGVKGDELKALQDSMHQAGDQVVQVYPALVTVALGLIACLNLSVLARVAQRSHIPVFLGNFRQFRNPEHLVWLLIAAGFALLLDEPTVHLVSLNLLIVVGALYAVQGFAVMSHFFRRMAIPGFMKVIGVLFLLFQPFMMLVVAVLGIFDLWGDFRSPKKTQNL